MLAHRVQRWPNISPILAQCPVFARYHLVLLTRLCLWHRGLYPSNAYGPYHHHHHKSPASPSYYTHDTQQQRL